MEEKNKFEILKDEILNNQSVRKNNKTKRAFKIGFIKSKLNPKVFTEFLKFMGVVHGIQYNKTYKGFLIEEVEYKEDYRVKTTKELQEEWLKKNKIKKSVANQLEISDIERKSKGLRDSYNNETLISGKYHGLCFFDGENKKISIFLIGQKTVLNKSNKKRRTILYYKIGNRRVRESTIDKKLESGEFTINKKDTEVNKFTIDNSCFEEDERLWLEE